ncbi:MAG: peptide deformylase [Micrococcaceae bacterium]
MSILGIRTLGDPILLSQADEVTEFDGALKVLIEDMIETMEYAHGVGLAAPQIGVGLRIFTYKTPEETGYVINPIIEETRGKQDRSEGCLSIPGVSNPVVRPSYTKVIGVDSNQNPITIEGEGLIARVLEHEIDHLNGKLYLSRLKSEDRKRIMKDLRESTTIKHKANKIVKKRQSAVNSSFMRQR